MDVIKTGVFQISTGYNEFWTEWQEQLAKEDLKRRAKAAMDKIMRDGVPYVTCLYPVKIEGNKLVLDGFVLLALWEDCEIGEAVFLDWDSLDLEWIKKQYGRSFVLESRRKISDNETYIYRRVE